MIVSFEGLLRAALEQAAGPVLALSYGLPPAFEAYSGTLTFYGAHPPPPRAPKREPEAVIDGHDAELLRTLERHTAEQDRPPYRLIYVSHHRKLDRIVRAVNALRRWSDAETVWIFPGAAPPERAMTGLEPRHAWWMGETWLLPEVLRPAGPSFQVLTAQLPPLGVTLARDFQPLDLAQLLAASVEAAATRPDTRSWRSTLGRAPLQALEALLGVRGATVEPPAGLVEVVVDPSDHDVLRSDLLEAEDAWERPPPEFVLDLSGGELDTRLLHQESRSRQGSQIDHFGPVQVLGRDVLLAPGLTPQSRRFYCKNSRSTAALGSLGTAVALNDEADSSTAMSLDNDRFFFPKERLDEVDASDEPVFLATPDEPRNWGMWLLYNVPSAFEYPRYQSEYPRFLCAWEAPWQLPLLRELGIPEDALLQHRMERVLRVPALASYRQTFRGMVLRDSDLAAFDHLSERYATGESSPERIYVSRKAMRHYRVLTNEHELEEALEARGFVSVSPELLPFREQVRLFRGAKVVVGLGGAGLFNVAFCQPGVRVVAIESGMKWVDSHANLIASRGARYGVILGRQDPEDPTVDHKRWWLDVPRAVGEIEALIS